MTSLIYITFSSMYIQKSGSSVRPQKMLDAFKKLNINILKFTLINGKIYDYNNEVINFRKFKKTISDNDIKICYIESPTIPYNILRYTNVFRYLKKQKIKSGYFFRDMHYKYRKEFDNNSKGFHLKDKIKFVFNKYAEILIGNYFDIAYFPTHTFSAKFKYKVRDILPPGADKRESFNKKNIHDYEQFKCIYVGGLSERYGTELLIDTFERLDKLHPNKFILKLICRENEYKAYANRISKVNNIQVLHLSNHQLEDHYMEANLALIPLQNTNYNNTTIAVKLFEYISYKLPILSVNCFEMAKIISENNIGLISNFNYEEFASKIIECDINKPLYQEFSKGIELFLQQDIYWIDRARKVIVDLVNK